MKAFAKGRKLTDRCFRAAHSRRLILESLESRRLLTTIQVTTLVDNIDPNDGVTSLREAIESANVGDEIRFSESIFGNAPASIVLELCELQITDSVTIVGPIQDLLTIDANQQPAS